MYYNSQENVSCELWAETYFCVATHDHNGETLTGRSPDFFGDLENLNRQNPVKWFIGYTAQIDILSSMQGKRYWHIWPSI